MTLATDFANELDIREGLLREGEVSGYLVRIMMDTGLPVEAFDLNDLPTALLEAVEREVELPHIGWIGAHLGIPESGSTLAVPVGMAVEGLDGPLRIRFSDHSELTFP